MKDKGEIFAKLIHIAAEKGVKVQLFPEFQGYEGRLRGNRIGLRSAMSIDDINYTLAHELAHFYLHFDKGDTIGSEGHSDYEEQADRTALLLLDALAV